MPTSNLHIAPSVVHLVHEAIPHDRVLDVGPGHGKYAVLLREYLNEPPKVIDAVEAWAPYITEFSLGWLYETVYAGDVCEAMWRSPMTGQAVNAADQLATYDVVLMCDVIEHIEKSHARAVLDRIPGRVVICTPVDFFSNGPGLPPTETHRSHWTADDWADIARVRPVEVCRQQIGGWLVRLGPRP